MNGRPRDGVPGFVADLEEWGVNAEVQEIAVIYDVRAPEGALEGQHVSSAVAVSELGAWPAVPPHFVHFKNTVNIVPLHSDQSDTLPGWIRHSRQIERWDTVAEPGRAWLAHVRSVVAKAI